MSHGEKVFSTVSRNLKLKLEIVIKFEKLLINQCWLGRRRKRILLDGQDSMRCRTAEKKCFENSFQKKKVARKKHPFKGRDSIISIFFFHFKTLSVILIVFERVNRRNYR